MEVSRNELARTLDGVAFRMDILRREPVENPDAETRADYPAGVRFVGIVTGKGWWQDAPEVGTAHAYTLYMNADGRRCSLNGSLDSGDVYAR